MVEERSSVQVSGMTERPVEPAERARIDAIEQLCGRAWAVRPQARLQGRLRIQSGGREREILLGSESFSADGVMVIDWERAPLGEVFSTYRIGDDYELDIDADRRVQGVVLARELLRTGPRPRTDPHEPTQLELREIDDGEVCLYRREPGSDTWLAVRSRLRRTIELRDPQARRKASSPIEVELDPVQRAAVELPAERSLLVLGEAGFGKTTVALHRLVHLHRQAEARGEGFAGLMLVPTKGLRRLLVALLERMGVTASGGTDTGGAARVPGRGRPRAAPPAERRVEVRTFGRWISSQGRRAFPDLPERDSQHTPLATIRLKRHPALRTVLPRIVAGTAAMREVEKGYRDDERPSTRDALLHLFGDRELLGEVFDHARGTLGASAVSQTLAHTRVQFTPTTEHALAHVDRDRLATIDGRAIDEGTPLADAETLDVEDFPVLFELGHLRALAQPGTPEPKLQAYDHVVLDEAQEFAPIELAVIGRALRERGSITVAGDENQQVDETTLFTSWPEVMRELGRAGEAGHEQVVLRESYRCPPAIEALARGLVRPGQVAEDRAALGEPARELAFTACAHDLELVCTIMETLEAIREHDRLASVAIVCRFVSSARRMYGLLSRATNCRLVVDGDFRFGPGISVTSVDEVKGLEFDYVILPDLTAANYPDTGEARRALYVAMTRAMHRLWLLWTGRRSVLLGH